MFAVFNMCNTHCYLFAYHGSFTTHAKRAIRLAESKELDTGDDFALQIKDLQRLASTLNLNDEGKREWLDEQIELLEDRMILKTR